MNGEPDKPTVSSYLITIIAAALNKEAPPPIPQGVDLARLYNFADWHSVANLASYGLSQLELPPAPIELKPFQESRNKGLAREARQELEARQVLAALEEHQIRHMPLKGYIIKNLYPRPDMRTMGDVDILVDASQLKKTRDLMLSLGYACQKKTDIHYIYYKHPMMYIEIHYVLFPKSIKDLYAYYGDGWNHAKLQAGTNYRYVMSIEDFYIYLFAHLAKHYRSEGTGIRSVMDVWVYNQHFKDRMDWDYINKELGKAGLRDFAGNIEALSEYWFSGKIVNEVSLELAKYVLANGTYGSRKNAAMNKFIRGKNDRDNFTIAKAKYAFGVLFPNEKRMVEVFPFLKKLPWLLPVCWVLRIMQTILFRWPIIKQNLHNISSINKTRIGQMMKIQQ